MTKIYSFNLLPLDLRFLARLLISRQSRNDTHEKVIYLLTVLPLAFPEILFMLFLQPGTKKGCPRIQTPFFLLNEQIFFTIGNPQSG